MLNDEISISIFPNESQSMHRKIGYKSRSSNEVGFLQETRPAIVHVCTFIHESCACVHTNKIKNHDNRKFFFFFFLMQAGGV